jgi:glyoxylase-like metal-dependent hydrolase (beta-lactamase superfamily II)
MGVNISPIEDDIFAVNLEGTVDVRALLIYGRDVAVLIDTLVHPSDLQEVRTRVEERGLPLFIVNSHADWDHWWGNAAFPGAPIIGHRLTQIRQQREGKRELARHRQKDPIAFANMELRPVTVAFDGELALDLGGIRVELSLLPGHTHDCIVAYLPERRLLFAGDAAEDPLPLVTEGPIRAWETQLLDWSRRARVVVPAHGSISGPELLTRNAAYLHALLSDPDGTFPDLVGADAFYRRAHQRNLKQAAREL